MWPPAWSRSARSSSRSGFRPHPPPAPGSCSWSPPANRCRSTRHPAVVATWTKLRTARILAALHPVAGHPGVVRRRRPAKVDLARRHRRRRQARRHRRRLRVPASSAWYRSPCSRSGCRQRRRRARGSGTSWPPRGRRRCSSPLSGLPPGRSSYTPRPGSARPGSPRGATLSVDAVQARSTGSGEAGGRRQASRYRRRLRVRRRRASGIAV